MRTAHDVHLYDRKANYIPRIAAVHDLCGYGKCSLGVAIPVLSAAGCDVCPVPTGLFSAHTRYPVFHMHDTTEMLEPYLDAWVAQRYATYTEELCQAMAALVDGADVLTPNLTEASILTGIPYEGQDVSVEKIHDYADALLAMGAKTVVLKGVVRGDGLIRNYLCGADIEFAELSSELLPYMLHGTGDLYASALLAAIMCGRSLYDATAFAGDFVRDAMVITREQPDFEMRGVSFESRLGEVAALLG